MFFQQINGLLNRCAQAGNVVAQYLLAETILLSSYELCRKGLKRGKSDVNHRLADKASSSKIPNEDSDPAAYFLAHFVPENACFGKASCLCIPHSELVKLFLRQCSPYDFENMSEHLKSYLDYFVVPGSNVHCIMKDSINEIHNFGDRVTNLVLLGRIKKRLNYLIWDRRDDTLFSRQSNDYPFCQNERAMALEEETLRSVIASLELRVRSWVPDIDFEAGFGANMQYHPRVLTLFEECRSNVILAFSRIFC